MRARKEIIRFGLLNFLGGISLGICLGSIAIITIGSLCKWSLTYMAIPAGILILALTTLLITGFLAMAAKEDLFV